MKGPQFTARFLWLALGLVALTPFGLFLPLLQDIGLAGMVLLILLALFDYWLTPRGEVVRIERFVTEGMTTFIGLPVELRMRGLSIWPLYVRVKDEPPAEFEAIGHDLRLKLVPGRDVLMRYTIKAKRRGEFAFGDVAVEVTGPLGLAARRFFAPLKETVSVYPDVRPLRQYVSLLARREEGAMGVRTKKYFGQGSSFESLRPYVEGDDPRKVDWKATARASSLIVRNYEEEPYQDVVAMLDCGRRMRALIGEKTKLDYAVDATLLLGYAAGLARDNVGLVAFDQKVQAYHPPQGGAAALKAMGEILYRVQPRLVEPYYEEILTEYAGRHPRRSLILLFSDLSDEYSSRVLIRSLVALKQRHVPVLVLFRDTDLEAVAASVPKNAAEMYRKAAAIEFVRLRRQVIQQLRTAGVDVVEAEAAQLAIETVNAYFRLKTSYF